MQRLAMLYKRWARELALAAAGLLAAAVLYAALTAKPEHTAWLALAVAIPTLATAAVALVKTRLLEFSPHVLGGDVIIPRLSRTGGGAKLLLPLQFTNAGFADGVIQWVALRLTVDGRIDRSILLSPVAEVDMQRFIQAKKKLDDSMIEPFTAFPLEGKRALARFILFDVAEPRLGLLELRPARYGFELFMKASNSRHPKLERAFEHVLDQKQLDDYQSDSTVYLINYEITLPAARRALAGTEWLPGAGGLAS